MYASKNWSSVIYANKKERDMKRWNVSRKFWVVLAVLLLASFWVGPAGALNIVDTGTPTGEFNLVLGSDVNQQFAGEFTLSQPWMVTKIQGWMREYTDGLVDVVIYKDDNTDTNIPGTEIFSTSFDVPVSSFYGWSGPSNLNLTLVPDTYWVGFRKSTGSSFFGAMQNDAPQPLLNEAMLNINYSTWTPKTWELGYFIEGNPVPLPPSVFLLATGFLGLGLLGRRRRR
jgi:hypothetical protein